MQTPAELCLIDSLRAYLADRPPADVPRILNIGAGESTVIEQTLVEAGCRFVCDRLDVVDCNAGAGAPGRGRFICCSVEDMKDVENGTYSAAFANYVLEHVGNLDRASSEIFRVLVPGGLFMASVPNLTAPEFVVARHAPAGLQRLVTRGRGFHTCYAWSTIDDLAGTFEAKGFVELERRHWAFTRGYLESYPVLGTLSALYDGLVAGLGVERFMGNVFLVFKKP
jgi:SAM-dependent methyltransferase